MNWWVILIIVLLGLIALFFSIWYALSIFKISFSDFKKNKVSKNLIKQKSIDFNQVEKMPNDIIIQGIYGFFVGPELDESSFFVPLFIGKSFDIIADFKKHQQNISNLIAKNGDSKNQNFLLYQQVNSYLKHEKKNITDIKFIIFETLPEAEKKQLDQRLKYWLNKTQSQTKGFNK